MNYFDTYESPLGTLLLASDGQSLTALHLRGEIPENRSDLPIFRQTKQWLDAYFAGDFREADFPLNHAGTAFQKQVWEILLKIPAGKTRSYGDIAGEMATLLGKEKMSAQAIGGAVGKNPIAILIPCHRVVGSRGQLAGYAGGLENKEWLLRHEGILECTF